MRRRTMLGILAAAVLAAAGCGGGDSSAVGRPVRRRPRAAPLNVFAAASLTEAFTKLAQTYQSDSPGLDGEAQLRRLRPAGGADRAGRAGRRLRRGEPEVPRGAPGQEPARRHDELRDQHAGRRSSQLPTRRTSTTVNDLKKGAKLVVADPAVPLGAYTETVLENLGISESDLNIVSKEQDAKSVLAKISWARPTPGSSTSRMPSPRATR